MEPNAPSPKARLELLRDAADAGLRTTAMVSPWLVATGHPEGELIEMIELLGQAGCRNITIDRLRLRPTAVRRIRDTVQKTGHSSSRCLASVADMSEKTDVGKILESIQCESRFPEIAFEIPKID
jgi:DNA repair photolyase